LEKTIPGEGATENMPLEFHRDAISRIKPINNG